MLNTPGALQLKLDAFSVRAATADARWTSTEGAADQDHYLVRISPGALRVTLEEDASLAAEPVDASTSVQRGSVAAALNVVLDGVARRSPA